MNVGDWVKLKPEPLRSFVSVYERNQPAFAQFWGQQHQIIALRGDAAVFRYPKRFMGGTEFILYLSQIDFVRKGAPPKCGWAGCTVKDCTTIPIPPHGEHDDDDDYDEDYDDECPDCGYTSCRCDDACMGCGLIDDCDCDEEDEEEDDDDE